MSDERTHAGDAATLETAPVQSALERLFLGVALTKLEFTWGEAQTLVEPLSKRGVAIKIRKYKNYVNLPDLLRTTFEERFALMGMSEAEAAQNARAVMPIFEQIKITSAEEFARTVEIAIATAEAVWRGTSQQFQAAAEISLPSKAPETWAERDRSKKETPIEFLNRVWGPYMEASVLYQDDIKRLGDPDLVQAVRNYCIRHEMKAADVLPPPAKVRLERALAAAEPGSLEAAYYKQRLRSRRSSTVSKRRKRAPHP